MISAYSQATVALSRAGESIAESAERIAQSGLSSDSAVEDLIKINVEGLQYIAAAKVIKSVEELDGYILDIVA